MAFPSRHRPRRIVLEDTPSIPLITCNAPGTPHLPRQTTAATLRHHPSLSRFAQANAFRTQRPERHQRASGWGLRRLLRVRRYAGRLRGVGFAPVGGGCGDSWAGGLAGCSSTGRFVGRLGCGLVGGVWLVSGSAGRVFAGWRACKAPSAEQPVMGGRSPASDPLACMWDRGHLWGVGRPLAVRLWGPRTPCGGVGPVAVRVLGTSDTEWGPGTGQVVSEVALGVRARTLCTG